MASEHRSVKNTEDFTDWIWGDAPKPVRPSDDIIIELFKEWAEALTAETHEKSCAIGAAVAFEQLVQDGFFSLEGITDKGLLIEFWATEDFCIQDEFDIVDRALDFDDPQHFSAHLRRLADAIDAAIARTGTSNRAPT